MSTHKIHNRGSTGCHGENSACALASLVPERNTLAVFLCRKHRRHRNVDVVEPKSSLHRQHRVFRLIKTLQYRQRRYFFAVNIVDTVDIAISAMFNQYRIYIVADFLSR